MENAAEILVIIVSSVLAVFLIVGIILAVMLIRLTKKIKQVADKAEGIVGNVEAAANVFKNAAGPMAVGKLIMNIADTVMKHKKRKG